MEKQFNAVTGANKLFPQLISYANLLCILDRLFGLYLSSLDPQMRIITFSPKNGSCEVLMKGSETLERDMFF